MEIFTMSNLWTLLVVVLGSVAIGGVFLAIVHIVSSPSSFKRRCHPEYEQSKLPEWAVVGVYYPKSRVVEASIEGLGFDDGNRTWSFQGRKFVAGQGFFFDLPSGEGVGIAVLDKDRSTGYPTTRTLSCWLAKEAADERRKVPADRLTVYEKVQSC